MNTDLKPSIVQMEPKVLRQLVKEVKETVATDLPGKEPKQASFGIIDLWNIRRNARTSADFLRR